MTNLTGICHRKSIIPILFLLIAFTSISTARYCKIELLYKFGLKSLCESENGLSVSCLDNPIKAYIQCQSGYYNKKNITLQTITCMDNGEWSEAPIKCKTECTNNPEKIESIAFDQLNFPTSYVEIFEISSDGEETNKFSGLIIYERKILTTCQQTEGKRGYNFRIRIYYPKLMLTKEIFYYDIDRIKYNNQEYCILSLGPDNYIKFDKNIKPNCLRLKLDKRKILNERDSLLPEFKTKCFPPNVDTSKVEMLCYNQVSETFYEVAGTGGGLLGGSRIVQKPVDCSKGADHITLQCPIGYQNKKSIKNDYLNRCSHNKWEYETEDSNDCERVCGEIDRIYEPVSIPLLFKGDPVDIISAPWHVGIYTNNTKNFQFTQVCGGSLIHSNLVISAGHCFDNLATGGKHDVKNYLIGAGKRYRKYDIVEQFQHYAGVIEIHTPQNYQAEPVRNDIAILILDHHIEYTSHIKPICVEWKPYEDYHVQDRVIGRLFGWGSTSMDDTSSGELLTIEVLTITNGECRKMVNPNYRAEITGDRFCATNDRNATACRGDSGGGFVIKKGFINRGNYYLLGVVSAGIDYKKYCSDGFITTFTNIQFFQDFLKFIIERSRTQN